MGEVDYETIVNFMDRVVSLMGRVRDLEEECKQLRKKVFSLEAQLDHQIPRINDIEDKIDWSKKGKI